MIFLQATVEHASAHVAGPTHLLSMHVLHQVQGMPSLSQARSVFSASLDLRIHLHGNFFRSKLPSKVNVVR